MHCERGTLRLANRAGCATLASLKSLLIFTCWERHSGELLVFLVLAVVPPTDLCWFGWDLAVSARLCYCCWLVFAVLTLLNCIAGVSPWTELLISWQLRWDLLQGTISKQLHFPCILSFPLVGSGLEGSLRHLNIIIINRASKKLKLYKIVKLYG